MKKIAYSTGEKTFEVAGGEISFNPADTKFAKKLYDCFDKLANMQKNGEEQNEEIMNDGEKLFELIEKREAEMRDCIEEVFGEGSAEKIFPNIGLYAIADGLPVWTNFLLAIIDIVDASMTDEQKKATPRAEMLMKKYGKYIKK